MDIIRHPNPMGQITLPKEYFSKLGLSYEDYFRIQLKDDTIILTPLNIEPKFARKELNKLKMLFDDKKNRGQIFSSSKNALASLKKRIKKR